MTPNTKQEHPEWMSFSEKKRHFEKTNNEMTTTATTNSKTSEEVHNSQSESTHHVESYSESKRFSYLSQNELEKLREEENRKLSTFSEQQLRNMLSDEDEDDDDLDNHRGNGTLVHEMNDSEEIVENSTGENGSTQRRVFRTAKAERLYHKKMGLDVESEEYGQMTPSQKRAVEAEKRKEWRQARLKSLEDDSTMSHLLSMKNYDQWAEYLERAKVDQIDEDEDDA